MKLESLAWKECYNITLSILYNVPVGLLAYILIEILENDIF